MTKVPAIKQNDHNVFVLLELNITYSWDLLGVFTIRLSKLWGQTSTSPIKVTKSKGQSDHKRATFRDPVYSKETWELRKMDPPKKDLLVGISQLVNPYDTGVFDPEFPKRSLERLGQIRGLEGCDQIKWLVGEISWETSTKK